MMDVLIERTYEELAELRRENERLTEELGKLRRHAEAAEFRHKEDMASLETRRDWRLEKAEFEHRKEVDKADREIVSLKAELSKLKRRISPMATKKPAAKKSTGKKIAAKGKGKK